MRRITLADAAKLLREEEKETLVQMVIDFAEEDERLQERLMQYAARRFGPASGVATTGRALERAIRIRGFVEYREAGAWARGVDRAIDNVGQLMEDGHSAAVIGLCESALQRLVVAAGKIDDSNGHLGSLTDRLQDYHLRACQESRPDPEELAKRLFHWELHGGLDIFYGAAERYKKVLGAEGLKQYRELAEVEWAKVPVRTAREERSRLGAYFKITQIMESLAKTSGDVYQLVGVMSRDLSSAYRYVQIAEVYKGAGRHDEALEWAEKGLTAFPEKTDGRLREFAADIYDNRQRHDDAMILIWLEFLERPCLISYRLLEKYAKKALSWPEWRERALAEIRRRIAKGPLNGRAPYPWMESFADRSQLIDIFLDEGDADAAWKEAGEGGCSDRLWLQLATARDKEHPGDAALVYVRLAEAALASARNGRYQEPVEFLVMAANSMKRANKSGEFVRVLEALRVKYKIKRNFNQLVERNRNSLYLA